MLSRCASFCKCVFGLSLPLIAVSILSQTSLICSSLFFRCSMDQTHLYYLPLLHEIQPQQHSGLSLQVIRFSICFSISFLIPEFLSLDCSLPNQLVHLRISLSSEAWLKLDHFSFSSFSFH